MNDSQIPEIPIIPIMEGFFFLVVLALTIYSTLWVVAYIVFLCTAAGVSKIRKHTEETARQLTRLADLLEARQPPPRPRKPDPDPARYQPKPNQKVS